MKKLFIIALSFFMFACSEDTSPVYLGANGITVKAEEGVEIGSKWIINGVEYTVVDISMLVDFLNGGEDDLEKVCTSRITNMGNSVFRGNLSRTRNYFITDMSAWDVSNVRNMSAMFASSPFNQDLSAWDVSNVTDMVICLVMHITSTKTSVLGM